MLTYETLETSLAAWAQTQPAVRAVITCGSRARGEADRWSDLDAILFVTDRERYAADPGWLREFGEIWLTYGEATDPGDPEWYAIYEGGLKLDVVLLDVKDDALDLEALLALYPYQGVFGRGVNVLYDQRGSPRRIPPKPRRPAAPPSAAEFDHAVSGLLMSSATVAKFIGRGDFYRAQRWFANDLHVHLLRLIEWQAHGRDTWYAGRYIEQWADPRVLAALPQTFPLLERESLSRSLLALLDLTRWLGEEVAGRFGFAYPARAHGQIAGLVTRIVEESA